MLIDLAIVPQLDAVRTLHVDLLLDGETKFAAEFGQVQTKTKQGAQSDAELTNQIV